MLSFFSWYFATSFLGLLTFPLAYRLFPALADRGYSLARALGLLLWGYIFWLLASLGIALNNLGGLILALVVLAAVSGSGLLGKEARKSLREWLRSNIRIVVTVEILFFIAFATWAFVRASNPNIETMGGEKTMELAFINAILRSPTFPPHDPWLSGYAISYYYFGYVMTAMLARTTGTLGSVAHNLMSALVFALSLVGAYGVLYNLLGVWLKKAGGRREVDNRPRSSVYDLPLLGPLFLLFVSNLEGFLEVLHSRGLFWTYNADGTATFSFWKWLDIPELNQPPVMPLGWIPKHLSGYWWWQASRVIFDRNLVGNGTEIIDEFPFFSYLLGDLHPHVLAMPFVLLAVVVALNLFLGGWKGETDLGLYQLSIRPAGLFFGGLLLGGLTFLNTWDILIGFALFVGAYALARALEGGWTWERLKEILALGVSVGLLAILLYLPFYVGFSSQAGGILPNLEFPTRGAHLWVMFGPLFIPLFAYLLYLWRGAKCPANWKTGLGLAFGLTVLLWVFSWLLGLLAKIKMPDFVAGYLANQGFQNAVLYFSASTLRRFSCIGGLLTLLGLLGPALAFLVKAEDWRPETEKPLSSVAGRPLPFVLLLIILGALLVLAPEFVFLRDLFGSRTNTIFKFYYQAWLMWSLVAAFGVAVLLQKLRGVWNWVYRVGLTLVLFMALVYPILGLLDKTNNFRIPAFVQNLKAAQAAGDSAPLQTAARVWTLDGAQLFQRQYPDDAAAALWLSTAPAGVIAEVVGKDTYSDYGRMAVYSGQPTVLGWWWHEYQWRGSVSELVSQIQSITCRAENAFDSQRTRFDDIRCLYETRSWEEAFEIIAQYNIRYVVIGTLERRDYHINELKFQQHLMPVFQQGQVVIYEMP